MAYSVPVDDVVQGLCDFGDDLVYANEVDRRAAMADYEFDNAKGAYINYQENDFDSFDFDDPKMSSSKFPPKISEYISADMSVQPGITMDKARGDIFTQYKLEFQMVTDMIKFM